MTFTPKTWTDAPSTVSPLSAGALIDLETRLAAYTDTGNVNQVIDASGHGTADFAVLKEAPLNVQAAEFGAACDGTTLDDVAMARAVAALPGRGGEILIPGPMALSSPLNLDSHTSITLMGLGGITAGAQPASSINFTQSGSSSALSIRNTYGLTLRDLGVLSVNSSFTGSLIDASWTGSGGDGGYLTIENAILFGNPNCARLLDLHQTQEGNFRNVNFLGATVGVRGLAGGSNDFSNAQLFQGCAFRGSVTASVQFPGQGWTFICPTVEPLSSGAAGFINAGLKTSGLSVFGGWFGDTVTGVHILLSGAGSGGITIAGTYLGGSAIAVDVAANISGLSITGNKFDQCVNGVAFQASVTCDDVFVTGNDFSTCSTTGVSQGAGATFTRSLLTDNKGATGNMYGVTVH